MTRRCSACGDAAEDLHFESDRSDTICCECFKQRFDFHDACVHDSCRDGDHDLRWDGRVPVCSNCGVSAQTLTDHCNHEQWLVGGSK